MFNNSDEWIEYCQTVHPRGMDLGLHRISLVADHLQLRKMKAPVITVAGTNGKGSTVAMLSALYLANGYRVASYTSPHILQFHERYQINGQSISEENLLIAFEVIENARIETNVTLTYFEFAVLIALWIFQQTPLDVIIIEVGLGGRLDATNIVDCDCAVITNIDFDHQAILGNTREAIGFEKAGIIREKKPVIFGDIRQVQSIIDKARECQAPFYPIGDAFNYQIENNQWTFKNSEVTFENLPIPALPIVNASIVLQTAWLMQAQLPIDTKTISLMLKQITLEGRWQSVLGEHCEIRCDVAHNPQSAEYLANLCERFPVTGKNIAVCSILADKDQQSMLNAVRDVFDDWFVAPLYVQRGSSAEELRQQFNNAKIDSVHHCQTINEALTHALESAKPEDRIICFGSFYTVEQSLKTLQNRGYTARKS